MFWSQMMTSAAENLAHRPLPLESLSLVWLVVDAVIAQPVLAPTAPPRPRASATPPWKPRPPGTSYTPRAAAKNSPPSEALVTSQSHVVYSRSTTSAMRRDARAIQPPASPQAAPRQPPGSPQAEPVQRRFYCCSTLIYQAIRPAAFKPVRPRAPEKKEVLGGGTFRGGGRGGGGEGEGVGEGERE